MSEEETIPPIIGQYYIYKRDNRKVRVVMLDEKRERVEVIEGDWNPFWLNYCDLKEII